jgi:predicted DNA-binding transcriptional regulator YafY
MLRTSERLLRLLTLLQARRLWTSAALAERLGVTERTVRRDVDRLRNLGYPVHSTPGVTGGYRLEAGSSLPPLLLEDDEALAVSVGLRTAAGGTVAGMEEAALRALTKLEQVMPVRLRHRVNALSASIVPMGPMGPTVNSSVLATLAGACRDNVRLHMQYEDSRGRKSDRQVEPQGLVHAGSRWYLVAWDAGRSDWRTFRVDRIAPEIATGARFAPRDPPDGGDLAAYVSRSVSTGVYPARARVLLHAPYEQMIRRISPLAGQLTRVDARSCILETGAHSLHLLSMWIAFLEVDFEVQEPPEILEHLRLACDRLGRALSSAGGAVCTSTA